MLVQIFKALGQATRMQFVLRMLEHDSGEWVHSRELWPDDATLRQKAHHMSQGLSALVERKAPNSPYVRLRDDVYLMLAALVASGRVLEAIYEKERE